MIVFMYQTPNVKACQDILEYMKIPGEARETDLGYEKRDAKIVWRGTQFLAIFYPEEARMELYPTKNTNSINYFINRYPELNWDKWKLVRTKRFLD